MCAEGRAQIRKGSLDSGLAFQAQQLSGKGCCGLNWRPKTALFKMVGCSEPWDAERFEQFSWSLHDP